ncbi:MAG: glutamate-5-semialdehyde dehydrogenase [Flavobacteriales bacterium]|nr:glutamate-5-semialdehyde dehydrogenase [Flavobacteriales bacterium]
MTLKSLFENAREASLEIGIQSSELKNSVLQLISEKLVENKQIIISENKKDLDLMDDSNPKKDRLLLNEDRIQGIADSIIKVKGLDDPAGKVVLNKELQNGLHLQKMYVPMGVVGVIFESRPNVTVDVSVLNIKSGNATILRGGSDAFNTNKVLLDIIQSALESKGLDKNIVQLMPVERELVKELLEAEKYVDMIIPRGSQALIDFVRENSKVPVIETGAGVCHTYVEKTADLDMAAAIVANAKIQRPSVCNSLDTIVLDKEIAESILPKIATEFKKADVGIYADETTYNLLEKENYPNLHKASEEDFGREYLSMNCSIKVVDGYNEALKHIQKYSSKHSECIVTENKELAEKYLQIIDAAAVYHNASTRFTDGEVFELGAEIGISTQKLHARGPFALDKLVTEKWVVRGNGQVR